MTVLLTGSFLATGAAFLTTVVLLLSLDSLIMLALPLPTLGAGAGAGTTVLLPLPTAVDASVAFLAAAPLVFAFSTIFVKIPAAPPVGTGADGLRGETGRAKKDFAAATGGRIGDRGSVRELADRGERT